ncbi:thioesterase family protein [Staphylococcus equorum]|uniref:acyl-CoA thioesterase n=1 Tax=Staphylococcus equorum TaxID=246432 RepID=UPI0018D8E54C|nr:thioesterase family protein [Staphylococcus equorum]QPS99466.1 thioesterase family protein [Staphylococcus equorum]
MNFINQNHQLDEATELSVTADGYHGHTSKSYANMIGPFGGIIASTLLKAVMIHPQCQGEPISLTINYAAPVSDGEFTVKANPVRTNRSTQHWFIELLQSNDTIISGTAVLAKRRATWSSTEAKMPDAPPQDEIKPLPFLKDYPWTQSYDIRIIEGAPSIMSQGDDDKQVDSVTTQWIQDYPQRTMDFLSLTAICDAFFPRIYTRRKQLVPIGTVSLTIYFHTDAKMLAQHAADSVLGQARALQYYNGFFDQEAQIWSPHGHLLATTHQIVYYKE